MWYIWGSEIGEPPKDLTTRGHQTGAQTQVFGEDVVD